MLFVSYSGATRDMPAPLRAAKAAGAKIILLTHYEDSPGAKLADIVLLCSHTAILPSRTGQLTISMASSSTSLKVIYGIGSAGTSPDNRHTPRGVPPDAGPRALLAGRVRA